MKIDKFVSKQAWEPCGGENSRQNATERQICLRLAMKAFNRTKFASNQNREPSKWLKLPHNWLESLVKSQISHLGAVKRQKTPENSKRANKNAPKTNNLEVAIQF